LAGLIIFLKSKRRRFNKKSQWFATGVLTGLPGHTGFFLTLFFLQPRPVPAPGWPAGLGRVSKLHSSGF